MNKKDKRFYFIVAGNYKQFNDYLFDNKIDKKDAKFVYSAEQLYGLYPDINDIILTGTYWDNSDMRRIMERISIIKSRQ